MQTANQPRHDRDRPDGDSAGGAIPEDGVDLGMGAAEPTRGVPGPRWYRWLMAGCGVVAAVLFGAIGVLMAADVLLRNLGFNWIPASAELAEYGLMTATFVAAPWLLHQNAHIRIDLIVNVLPKTWAWSFSLACDVLAGTVCGVLAWEALQVAWDAAEQQSMVFKMLMFPEWWLGMPLLVSAVLLTAEFGRRAWYLMAHPWGREN
ncbi:MAG: TRAP transporter small permease [Lautropia sp.]|nr:TRAP transporter small permease [Lautropia sp.]